MPYPSIVKLTVSTVTASAPSNLQQTGALVSQGATTLGANNYLLLTQLSDLTPLLASPLALTSLTWSAGTVTATTAAPIAGLSTGETFITTIAGASPTGYNGEVLATVTGASPITYALASNPGAETTPGTYTGPNQGELVAMATSFFGQGSSTPVYVLELGAGDGASGPTALTTFLTANPGLFYGFLVPRNWDVTANFLALIAQHEMTTAQVYFFVTTTTGNYGTYTAAMKDVVALVEAPGIPLTEFSAATNFQHALAYAPSSANKMTPNAFAYLFGATAYPAKGNAALLQNLLTAAVNFVGTGAEGGLTNSLIMNGTTKDGQDFAWWYSVDWIQVNGNQALAAAVIEGSNNPASPLYYNQGGINQLQDVLVGVVDSAVGFGLANGSVVQTALDPATFQANIDAGVYAGMNVVNAVPFATYTQQNPNDYGNRKYAGFSVLYLPMNGFTQVLVNITATNLIGSL